MKFEKTKEKLSLHGLGFMQLILPEGRRMHIWHPDLPRRTCFKDSAIHDHRFGFVSTVIAGTQVNQLYKVDHKAEFSDHNHTAFLHEGARTKFGNRPWVPDYSCKLVKAGEPRIVKSGESYEMNPYMLHSTNSQGVVVTIMHKTTEENEGARSFCKIGIDPDVDFDRKQVSESDLWEIFTDTMKRI